MYFNENLNPYQKFRLISSQYKGNSGYTSNKELRPGSGEVIAINKIVNGYEVKVNVSNPGVFILNTFPLIVDQVLWLLLLRLYS